jgi:hypothetical protein
MIISAYDAWLINVSRNLDILTLIFCITSGMSAPMIATIPNVSDKTRKKYTFIAIAIFAISGLIQILIPKPVVVEKYIIAKYSVPEVMDKFDSYDAFYNQIGLEIKKITNNRNERN